MRWFHRLCGVPQRALELHCPVRPSDAGVPLGYHQPDTALDVEPIAGQHVAAVERLPIERGMCGSEAAPQAARLTDQRIAVDRNRQRL